MADISKCNDFLCPSKNICYRYTAISSEYRQSWVNTNRDSDAYNCELFWHNGTCKYCGQDENNHKLSCASQKILINLSPQDKP
jgi:hypothetical protein